MEGVGPLALYTDLIMDGDADLHHCSAAGLDLLPLSSECLIAISHVTGARQALPPPAADLLASCRASRPLHEHAAAYAHAAWQRALRVQARTTTPLLGRLKRRLLRAALTTDTPLPAAEAEVDALERQLAAFAEMGLLVTEQQVRNASLSGQAEVGLESPPLTRIAIPTRDRPRYLARAVESYAANGAAHGRPASFLIADDARNASANAALGILLTRIDCRIERVDRAERERLVDRLACRAGVAQDLIRFALLGEDTYRQTYGAARNTLLLLTAGTRSVQVDDDTVCRPVAAPHVERELVLTSEDATDYTYASDRAGLLESLQPADTDFLGAHEALLGQRVHDLVAAADRLLSGAAGPRLFETAPSATVAATFAGTYGDAASTNSFYRLLHTGDAFDRLTAREAFYHEAMQTRDMARFACRPTVTDRGSLMTLNVGLDGQRLLPPFLPVLRNEDAVFGTLLTTCFRGSFRGFAPGCPVFHDPPDERPPLSAAFHPTTGAGIVNLLIREAAVEIATDEAAALRAVGARLEGVGLATPERFVAHVRRRCLLDAQGRLRRTQRALDTRPDGPAYWRADLERYRADVLRAASENQLAFVGMNGESEAARMQELVVQFGRLLQAWPALFEAARELNQSHTPTDLAEA